MPKIDQYSLAAIPIEMFFNAAKISDATAFVWHADQRHWLITCWHNVSGRDPNTGKHLSKTAAEPNRLRVWFNMKKQFGVKIAKDIDICSDTGTPLWLVHPARGSQIDVVGIPIQNYEDVEMYAINTMSSTDLLIQIGMDVFVLGFPFGKGATALPIWKRGSIASEPEITGLVEQHLFVDTASRPGMSGSPVIRRSWASHTLADGGTVMGRTGATKFVGIYSGRLIGHEPLDAQLGFVWPASLVSEIVAGGRIDNHPDGRARIHG